LKVRFNAHKTDTPTKQNRQPTHKDLLLQQETLGEKKLRFKIILNSAVFVTITKWPVEVTGKQFGGFC
jgi:hypothetical protein